MFLFIVLYILLIVLLIIYIYKNKNPIYAIPANQLGNCLRHIVSMKILADYYDRPFKIDISNVYSQKEKEILSILFKDYIDYNPSYNYYKQESICNFESPTNTNPIIEGNFKYIPKETFGSIHIYSIIHNDMSRDEYIKRKLNIYRNLNWPNFKFEKDLSNVIGVHLRFTDNFNDPSKNNLNTPLDVFIEKIKIIEKPFLLCSDNKEVVNKIKNMFPTDVILPNILENQNLQPIYEMMLLSKTKHIIGSYASTFSYESAFFHGTDLEVYENGEWKIYYCSNNK